jgi:putative ABC transport system ATP-binding protein
MIHLQNVTKVYSRRGNEVVALKAPSLSIAAGSYVAVVGPSGSGKTTLLSIVGGMLSPNAGQVSVDGASLYDLSVTQRARLRREKIGFVFQTFNLVPYLTAAENVQVPLCLAGVTPYDQRLRAAVLLDRVGLGNRMDHKPSELSTGQQQRVALARTLANNPTIILADEPTGNLDPESRERVLAFLDELHRDGRTIIMVTHDAVAAQRARQTFRLHDGLIVADDACPSTRAA